MPKKKTDFEKRIDRINTAVNRARSFYSLANQRTWRHILLNFGYELGDMEYVYPKEQLDKVVSLADITAYGKGIIANLYLTPAQEQPAAWTEEYEGSQIILYEKPIEVPRDEEPVEEIGLWQEMLPGQMVSLLTKQKQVAPHLFRHFFERNKTGALELAGTGTGKTYVYGSLIKNLYEQNFFNSERTLSPWPCVIITKAQAVIQTRGVMMDEFGLTANQVHVVNIEQLRAAFGSMFIKEEVDSVQGELHTKYVWKKIVHPCFFIWDECQILKNLDSIQSRMGQAVNEIDYGRPVYQLFVSATPFARVIEAKTFVVSTGVKYDSGMTWTPVTNHNYNDFANWVTQGIDPHEYSPTAMERLIKFMDEYIFQMKNVRPKFPPKNTIQMIDFQSEESRDRYDRAYQKFLVKKARIEGMEALSGAQTRMMILAQFTIFRKAAELERACWIADMFVDCWDKGEAGGAAVCFKDTIVAIVKRLVEHHGWSRDDISIIWGGAIPKPKSEKSKKKKIEDTLKGNTELLEQLKMAGISKEDLLSMGFDVEDDDCFEEAEITPEEKDWLKEHRMGAQDARARHQEVQRFQMQKSKCCIYTFKAGGAALSLHHIKPGARPRTAVITPTYSAMELVQGVGRFPRITSLSETKQILAFFRHTIEEAVAARVAMKLKCLLKVVRQNESWESIIIGHQIENEIADDVEEAIDGAFITEEEQQ